MPKDEKVRKACLAKIAEALSELQEAEGELTKESLSVVVGGAMGLMGAMSHSKQTHDMICRMLIGFLPESN